MTLCMELGLHKECQSQNSTEVLESAHPSYFMTFGEMIMNARVTLHHIFVL